MKYRKLAIITGASRGIGKEITIYLLDKGYKVIILSLNEYNLKALQEEINQDYNKDSVEFVCADVCDYKLVAQKLGDILKYEHSVDILINNAGCAMKGTSNLDITSLQQMVNTNLVGAVNITNTVLPNMNKFAHIINIASLSASIVRSEMGGYVASKAGLLGWSRALSKELIPEGIKVTSISPSMVVSEMTSNVSNYNLDDMVSQEDLVKTLDYILSLSANSFIENIEIHCASKFKREVVPLNLREKSHLYSRSRCKPMSYILKILTKPSWLFIVFTVVFFCQTCLAKDPSSQTTIKVAILDNFHFQPYVSNHFDKFYLAGIKLANHSIQQQYNYHIRYQVFSYDRTRPLAIFDAVKKVKAWHPDVILGPRNSNMFLLIKNSFKNILVISGFATSMDIKNMRQNYQSLKLTDDYASRAVLEYLEQNYPNKQVYAVVEKDCKNCVDFNREFSELYNQRHVDHHLVTKYFLQDDVEKLNISRIMNQYKSGQIILLPDTAYASAILMHRITNYLGKQTVFIGGDGWGNWKNTEVGKLHAKHPYFGIHVTPSSLDVDDAFVKRFKSEYRQYFHEQLQGNAALVAYKGVHAFADALHRYGSHYQNLNLRQRILNSYLEALHHHPFWFKDNKYAVYKVNNKGAYYLDTVEIGLPTN